MYLLDTNACIALIHGRPASVRLEMQRAVDAGESVWTSTVVIFELWYGVEKSSRREANQRVLQTFLAGPIGVLPFEAEDAVQAGALRASLESKGRPIGAYDLLIAAQALSRQMTMVTANAREFGRVEGLRCADWARK